MANVIELVGVRAGSGTADVGIVTMAGERRALVGNIRSGDERLELHVGIYTEMKIMIKTTLKIVINSKYIRELEGVLYAKYNLEIIESLEDTNRHFTHQVCEA